MANIAALPMYDFPEIRAHTDRFWQGIRIELGKKGIDAPVRLTRGNDVMSEWKNPSLLFSQTCGLPYVKELSDITQIIGTPDYDISSDSIGMYHSVIINAKKDPRQSLSEMKNSSLAYNDAGSQSGLYALMYMLLCENGGATFFSSCLESGGHAKSVAMIANGQAEIAAIDAVSWRFIKKYHPDAAMVKVIGITPETPSLPYICNRAQDAEVIGDAVERAIGDLASNDRRELGIRGIWRSRSVDYQIIADRASQVSGILENHGLGNNSPEIDSAAR